MTAMYVARSGRASTRRVPTAPLRGAFARRRPEARVVTAGEYLMSLPVEMQARDWKLETEPEAQHDLPVGWSRTYPMAVHGGHSAMASRSRPYCLPELRRRWRGMSRRSRCPHQSLAESRTRRHPRSSRPSPDRRRKQRRRSSKKSVSARAVGVVLSASLDFVYAPM